MLLMKNLISLNAIDLTGWEILLNGGCIYCLTFVMKHGEIMFLPVTMQIMFGSLKLTVSKSLKRVNSHVLIIGTSH